MRFIASIFISVLVYILVVAIFKGLGFDIDDITIGFIGGWVACVAFFNINFYKELYK